MDGDTVILSWRPVNFVQIALMIFVLWIGLALIGQGWRAWQNRGASN